MLDLATHKVRVLTTEADPQWDWTPVAWVDGDQAHIANRTFYPEEGHGSVKRENQIDA